MASRKKKKKKRRVIIFVVEIILLLTVLAALYIWSKYQRLNHEPDTITTEDVVNTDLDESTQQVLKGYTNVAVFGLDNRSNGNFENGNSDMIMIASINNDTQEVRLVSVYRDTYLNSADDGSFNFHKANYAYNSGGIETAIRQLNSNLDLDITDYVVVDFDAVAEAIDLLGGIEVEIDEDVAKWMNLYIAETAKITDREAVGIDGPGTYTLDGVQATAYCRIRYTDEADFGRAQRQREVLSKMVDKAKSAGLLTINKIINAVFDHISTNFTAMELITLASQMFNYELVDTRGFPFKLAGVDMGSKGVVVVPCDLVENVTELHQYLFGDYRYTPSNTVQTYSKQIEYETNKGLGDEEATGIKDDSYTKGGKKEKSKEDTKTDADTGTDGQGQSGSSQ